MTDSRQHSPAHSWGFRRTSALILASLILAAGIVLFSGRAWAVLVPVPETGSPGLLWLASTTESARFHDMSPGSVEHWQISANMAEQWSPLSLQFKRDGDLVSRPDGLNIQMQRCTEQWLDLPGGPHCPAGAVTVFGPLPASDASFGPLTANDAPLPGSAPSFSGGMVTSTQSSFVLVTLSIPDTPAARADETLMGLEATFGFGFIVSGDGSPPPTTEPDPGPGKLATAGIDAIAVALLAVGALGLGAVLLGSRRAQSVSSEGGAKS